MRGPVTAESLGTGLQRGTFIAGTNPNPVAIQRKHVIVEVPE
jgi:hypothetical protein